MSMHLFFKILAAAAMTMQIGGHANLGGKHMEAKGTFEVRITQAEATAFEKGIGVKRYEIDKTWVGDFAGTSKGEMLSSFTESTGSMAYVAMEQMAGKLGGKSGSFYLAHRATMTKGDAASGEMNVVVVKGSGTGELAGLSGELTIIIDAAGKHSYVFEYELP
ncbi:MAG: DUF3224 domain-containing protein [Terracidiphilus sp.]